MRGPNPRSCFASRLARKEFVAVAGTMVVFGLGAAAPLVLLGMASREAALAAKGKLARTVQIGKPLLGVVFSRSGFRSSPVGTIILKRPFSKHRRAGSQSLPLNIEIRGHSHVPVQQPDDGSMVPDLGPKSVAFHGLTKPIPPACRAAAHDHHGSWSFVDQHNRRGAYPGPIMPGPRGLSRIPHRKR